jgi:hypothetical protein
MFLPIVPSRQTTARGQRALKTAEPNLRESKPIPQAYARDADLFQDHAGSSLISSQNTSRGGFLATWPT